MEPVRKLVRHILEAAVAGQQAAAQNLALYRKGTGSSVVYVLYDPTTFATELPKYQDAGGDIATVIYGYLDVKPHNGDCWNAGEIKFSAARKGYGPLMYELAMSDFQNGLMSDRLSTSDAARNVWKKYAQRTDVGKKQLDDKTKPKTPSKADDCKFIPDFDGEEAYLNNVYVGRGDGGSKGQLMNNHTIAVKNVVANTGMSEQDVLSTIFSMGDEYFSSRYRDG